MEGVLSLEVYREADARQGHDVMSILAISNSMPDVLRIIGSSTNDRPEMPTITEIDAVYSSPQQEKIRSETVEGTWEEVAMLLHKTSSTDVNFVLLSIFAGVLSAIGLAQNSVFSIIAGMLLLPGFQPIADIPLGIVLRNRSLVRRGVRSTLAGYGIFILGAVATYYVMLSAGNTTIRGFAESHMVSFWTSINIGVLINALIASAAGVTVMATHESELTAGAMVALGLAPGLAASAISLTTGDWFHMWRGFLVWILDAGAVVIMGRLIFGLKQVFMHKRGLWY